MKALTQEEEKAELIAEAQEDIDVLEAHMARLNRHSVHFDLSRYESQLQRQKIALAALTSEPVAVPEGWKLVPVEMTDEIGEAIALEARCCGGIALDIYEAALKAAPAP